jgi:hypothetical protein
MVLWADIEVSHPDWKTTVKVPKWTQVWDKIKIPWKWFGKWWYFAKKWNLIVIPRVSIPKKLTKSQEKLRQWLRSD